MQLKWKQLHTLFGAIVLVLVIGLTLSNTKPASAEGSTCATCHGDKTKLESLSKRAAQVYVDPAKYKAESHGGLDCITCHAGDPTKETPQEACIGIAYKDPADPAVLEKTCGSCHPEIAARQVNSIHSTLSGIQLSLHDLVGVQEGESRFQETCNKCHATCSNCHMEEPGAHGLLVPRTESHSFAAQPAITVCVSCHDGTGVSYMGDPTKEGRVPSAMATAGLGCMNCHSEQDVHGTGVRTNFVVDAPKPVCATCHSDPTHTVKVADGLRVAPQFDPQNPAHQQHDGSLSCQACHTSWYENCWNCHEGREDRSNIEVYLARNPITGLIQPAEHSPASSPDWGNIPPDVGGGWAIKSRHSWNESKSCEYCHTNPEIYINASDRRAPFLGVWGTDRKNASYIDKSLVNLVVLNSEKANADVHQDVTCEECHATLDDNSCRTCHEKSEKSGKTFLSADGDWSRQEYMTASEGFQQVKDQIERADQVGISTTTWEQKREGLHLEFLKIANDFHGNPGPAHDAMQALTPQIGQLLTGIQVEVAAVETRNKWLKVGLPLVSGMIGAIVLGTVIYLPNKRKQGKRKQGENDEGH